MTPLPTFYPEWGGEPMLPERWTWVALYSNGTFLEQFGRDGIFHQFRDIKQDQLIGFQMINMLGDKPPILIHWKPGRKLIHFYRTVRLRIGSPDEIEIRIYCFGYETATDKMIMAIMPDDQIRVVESIDDIPIA